MKKVYEKPLSELYDIQLGGSLLQASGEKMNSITGSWDEETDGN